MATLKDLEVRAGSTREFVVDVIGGPESLVGYGGAMQMRELRFSPEVLAEVPESSITVNPGTRQVTVRIPSSLTETFDWPQAVYDLVIANGTDKWTLLEGRVFCSQQVTREV